MKADLIERLTWQDIKDIDEILFQINSDEIRRKEEEYYSEVITRLNKQYKTLPACKDRYKEILPVAENITGEKNRKERTFELTVLRCMIANRLKEEGYTLTNIAKAMGYDHSTIIFYFKKKADFFALPLMYEREVRWFKQFDEALKDGIDRDN